MTDPFYITTPIYYVNAKPHLGHAYTTIIADIASRFFSMKGADTFLLTGTDEHGDKIVEAAGKENLTPKASVDGISGLYQELWPKLDINFNYFVRTTFLKPVALFPRIDINEKDGEKKKTKTKSLAPKIKPAKLMGVLSKGMLLAATQDKELSVVTVDRKVKSGKPLS